MADSLPTIHLPGLFHTILDTGRHSSCAFSGKIRRFPKMMHLLNKGWRIIEYSNVIAESESEADEKVEMLTRAEFDEHYPAQPPTDFHGSYATIGVRGYPLFDQRLKVALSERVKPGDIISHPFGRSHADLVTLFPGCMNCELGIGYPDNPFGAYRCFESEAWRHYHWGRDDGKPEYANNPGLNKLFSAVVPNYFDLADWPIGDGAGDYLLFMGRIDPCKGISTIVEIIKREWLENNGLVNKYVFAGQGDFNKLVLEQLPVVMRGGPNISYVGIVAGKDRAALVGNARAMLMPTTFVEPFAGSGVESMLCGTPLISVNYGAFTETNVHGLSGYRCNTLGDWMEAIDAVRGLDRAKVAAHARARYSLEACAPQFDAFIHQLIDLYGQGWYTRKSHRAPGYSSSSPTSL